MWVNHWPIMCCRMSWLSWILSRFFFVWIHVYYLFFVLFSFLNRPIEVIRSKLKWKSQVFGPTERKFRYTKSEFINILNLWDHLCHLENCACGRTFLLCFFLIFPLHFRWHNNICSQNTQILDDRAVLFIESYVIALPIIFFVPLDVILMLEFILDFHLGILDFR